MNQNIKGEKISPFKRTMQKAILLLGITLLVLIVMNISPALPIIEKAFQQHTENARFYVMILFTTPSLAIGIFSPLCGKVIDHLGRKKTFILSLIVYSISGAAPVILNSLNTIIFTRFILGICTATISTSIMTLITDYYTDKEREQMMAYKSVAVGLGGFGFVIIGGWLAQFGWRTPFYLDLFPLLLVIPAWVYLDEPKFSRREVKNATFKNVPKWALIRVLTIIFIIKMIIYIIPIKVPYLMEEVLGSTPGANGVVLSFATVITTLSAFLFPGIRKITSHHQIFILCFWSLAISFLILSGANSYFEIFLALTFSGICFGWVVPNATLLVAELTPITSRGFMMGILTSCLFLGQFVTPFVVYPLEGFCGMRSHCGLFAIVGYFLLLVSLFFVFSNSSDRKTEVE